MDLILYSTAGCHLCELAVELINELKKDMDFTLNIIEIGDNDELVETYGIRIPVVKFNDNSELNWPFSADDLSSKINTLLAQ
jgi:hypothetical protein